MISLASKYPGARKERGVGYRELHRCVRARGESRDGDGLLRWGGRCGTRGVEGGEKDHYFKNKKDFFLVK
jgi:hypothetical protein